MKIAAERGALGRGDVLPLGFPVCAAFALLVLAGPPMAANCGGADRRPQKQLTVERIYSAPSLSGRPLRDTMWSPDGKLLTYLDDNASRPGNLGGGRSDRAEARVWWTLSTCATSCCRRHRVASKPVWGASRRRDICGRREAQALLFISAKELFWYDLKTRIRENTCSPKPAKGAPRAKRRISTTPKFRQMGAG